MDRISVQLRLRSAFRYGYYAFLTVMGGAIAVLFLGLDGLAFLAEAARSPIPGVIGMVGLGLVVPLFLLTWLLAGFALMPRETGRSGSASA